MNTFATRATLLLFAATVSCSGMDDGEKQSTDSGGMDGDTTSAGGSSTSGGAGTGGSGGGAPSSGGSHLGAGGLPPATGGGDGTGGQSPATGGADGTGGQPPATGGVDGTGGSGDEEISFDPAQQPSEEVAGNPYSPYPNGVVVTKVNHFDVSCWKIAAAGGTFYFENGETDGKSGFDSAFDMVGNDWIGNDADKGYNTSPKGSGQHEYRGWPNFGNGNFDHPQRSSGTSTRWVDEQGQDVAFEDGVLKGQHLIMRSTNGTYELEYHFFQSHAAIKVLQADDKYAFLYEGPIGGEMEDSSTDKWVTEDGAENGALCNTTTCFSPFIYFVDTDPSDTQVWYFGAANTTPGHGGDSYVQSGNMVVVSYGRYGSYPNDDRRLEGTEAISVFGFYSKAAGHDSIAGFINARLAEPFSEADPAGVMP